MHQIAVVLPAYNESQTIVATIEQFHKILPEAKIVVIDNASTDDTALKARATLKKIKQAGELITEHRKGKGLAVRAAFTQIEADYYLLCDADLTYPAKEAKKLLTPVIKGEADMVVGNRISGGHYADSNYRKYHNFGNKLVNFLINRLFRSNLKDALSGYRALSRKFVKNYPILVAGFQLETDMILHALDKNFIVREVEIAYKDRPKGSFSKLDTFTDGARVLFCIAQVLRYYRPFFFFFFTSLLFSIAGLVAAVPVFIDWIKYRYIYHLPLAVFASSLELVAIISFVSGLILDALSHQNKFNYQHKLLRYKDK